jgi:hypothetical protein
MLREIVGRNNVIARADCAWARLHPEIASAKLCVLRDGAAIASKKF